MSPLVQSKIFLRISHNDHRPIVTHQATNAAATSSDTDRIIFSHHRATMQRRWLSLRSLSARFCRAMLCKSAAIVVMRCPSVCLSVCLSVTFVSCAKTNKDIFNFFSLSGSHTILVFPHQTGWRYSYGNPLTGSSNAGRV